MEPKQLLETYHRAFNAKDYEALIDCVTPDIEHHVNQGGVRRGHEAFRAFCVHMARCYRERLEDIVLMVSDDGRVGAAQWIVHGRYVVTDEGLPPAHGQNYVVPGGSFFGFRDGRIARLAVYYNLRDWIDQVSQ